MNYLDFENRCLKSGGAERANYALFLQDLCDLLGVPRPDPTTDSPAQDAYAPDYTGLHRILRPIQSGAN